MQDAKTPPRPPGGWTGGKTFSMQPLPRTNVDSAPTSSPPAPHSLTFPLRPLKPANVTGGARPAKHRQAISAAANVKNRRTLTTNIRFIGGCFQIPLSAHSEQHIAAKKPRSMYFQRLPTLADSAFALCWPIRQQQNARDAAVGLLNRQVREQCVPLFKQEALFGQRTHTPTRKENALLRRLFAEIKQLRSVVAFVHHPIQVTGSSVSTHRHTGGEGGLNDDGKASARDSHWQKEFNRVMEENALISQQRDSEREQNMILQRKLAYLVSILDIMLESKEHYHPL